jgi:hemerythrin superfamily protein
MGRSFRLDPAIVGTGVLPRPEEALMATSNQSTDAIVLLKNDHKEIRRLFADFEKAGDNAKAAKQRLVDKIIELLTVHTFIENEVMYPRVRELLPDLEDDILESYEEHHVADVLVMELSAMSASDERFTAKTTVLIENVTHHIQEEEDEWFPQVREGLGRKALRDIGAEMQAARERAPRRPSQPSALKKAVDAVIS